MRKEASLPVRLDSDEKRRLKAAAERMELTVSAVIRLLVRSFVDEYDRSGGRLMLPPVWVSHEVGPANETRMVAEKTAVYATKNRRKG